MLQFASACPWSLYIFESELRSLGQAEAYPTKTLAFSDVG
jgi:hypothetical protein